MRRSFPASTAEKTTVSAGKNGPFAYAGKQMLYAPEFFPASTAEKTAVDAGKNSPVPTGYFYLPEAGKNRRKTVKGPDFLTV